MSATEKVKPAASVILLRPAQPQGFEVLLLHRPDDGPVHGGIHRIPGGAIQKSDHAAAILRRCRGLSGEKARKILGAHLAPSEALGFWIAAIRTLFEEVGILLAVKESGEPIAVETEADAGLRAKRAALVERRLDFHTILERENLFCDAATMRYFSHWRAESPDCGDTRIFLTAFSEGRPSPTAAVEGGRWLAPERALQLFSRGELPMFFTTFASLRTLADFGSVQSVLKEFQPEAS
jgi:8-oxo-dGTP pyrophosphatase MutT (NUDIX family)